MEELLFMRQLMGADGWLLTAMLVGLFLIVLMRREQIALPGLFRLGVVFFALSIAIPPFILPLAAFINGGNMGGFSGGGGESLVLMLFINGTGPILQSLCILCVFNAIMPRVFNTKPESTVPQKHPLD